MLKAILSIALAIILLTGGMPKMVRAEASYVVTRIVNAAKNKPVSASSEAGGSKAAAVTDDDLRPSNFWAGSGGGAGEWVVVDLLRKYKIERILLFDRITTNNPARGQFVIYGSNDAELTQAEELYRLDDNAAFPAGGSYPISFSEAPAYRYIKYQALNSGDCYLREIQIFSSVTATEVSRGKNVASSAHYVGLGSARAVDGNKNTDFAASVTDNVLEMSVYGSFTVDLGTTYPIGMIELYGRNAGDTTTIRGNFMILGSGTALDGGGFYREIEPISTKPYATLTAAQWQALNDYDYTPIAKMEYDTQSYTLSDGSVYEVYPAYAAPGDDSMKGYNTMINDENAYRYITYKKTAFSNMQFSELAAYVINPEIYNVKMDGRNIQVSFSDDMDSSTLNKENIHVTADSVPLDIQVSLANDQSVCIIELPEIYDSELEISFSEQIKNQKGTGLANEYHTLLEVGKELRAGEIVLKNSLNNPITQLAGESEVIASIQLENISSERQPAMMAVCLYDGNNALLAARICNANIESRTTPTLSAKLTLPSSLSNGCYVNVHVWDGYQGLRRWQDGINIPY